MFISSTSDLKKERDTVEQTLLEIDIDGSRFEFWPSTPNHPISECLQRIEESDAVVLLLGHKYGSITESGLSFTHLEYRHAKKFKKPVFAYVLSTSERENEQIKFLEEVRESEFCCREIKNLQHLKVEVKRSFIEEFTRCFKKVHTLPPQNVPPIKVYTEPSSSIVLPDNPEEAFKDLEILYQRGEDLSIHKLAKECEDKFGNYVKIMHIVYAAEVNLAINDQMKSPERVTRAIEFWDGLLKDDKYANYDSDYNIGNALLALKQYPAAIKRYKKYLENKSDFSECWTNLGSAYFYSNDIGSATQCFCEALKHNPQLLEALYHLATFALTEEQNPEKALAYLNKIKIVGLSPHRLASVQGWKAIAYMKLGKYPEGIAKSEDAIAILPDSEWSWNNAGRLYALIRQQDKFWLKPAAQFWERFVIKYPHQAEAWAELGFVYWFLRELGDKTNLSKRAFDAYQRAIKLGFEGDGLVWDHIGHLHQEKGIWEEAEKAYRQAAQNNSARFGYCHGVSLIFLERYEEALPLVMAAAQKHQPDAMSWFQVGVCYEKLGEIDKSVSAYKNALELNSNYPEAWFNLGGAYWNNRNFKKAKEIWEQAIIKFPDHPLCVRAKNLIKK